MVSGKQVHVWDQSVQTVLVDSKIKSGSLLIKMNVQEQLVIVFQQKKELAVINAKQEREISQNVVVQNTMNVGTINAIIINNYFKCFLILFIS